MTAADGYVRLSSVKLRGSLLRGLFCLYARRVGRSARGGVGPRPAFSVPVGFPPSVQLTAYGR